MIYLNTENLRYLLALLRLEGMGPVKLKKIIDSTDNYADLFNNKGECLIFKGQANYKAVDRDLAWVEEKNNYILTLNDPLYPKLLREIHSAPPILFVKGQIHSLSKPQIAIVGTRIPSEMGCDTAKRFASVLAEKGFVITSGLANGVDGIAHSAALEKSETIAVLANGLDHVYPAFHRTLSEKIVEKGALVTEFPLGVPPIASHFPRRNRIISGLSMGTLVVEAALKSGSLITANFALEQGREVFAIPGSIHSLKSKGCNALIRQGAKLVDNPEDILEELGPMIEFVSCHNNNYNNGQYNKHDIKESDQVSLLPQQELLLTQLGNEQTSIDSLVERLGLTVGMVSSMLLELELKGLIRSSHGGVVRVLN